MKDRGVDFLTIPKAYYGNLKKGLANAGIKVAEDIAVIEELNILVDYDDKGYLL